VLAAAGQNSRDRTHVAEIPAIRDGDVFVRRLHIVRRIKIQPAQAVTIDLELSLIHISLARATICPMVARASV